VRDKKIKPPFYRKWGGTDPAGVQLEVRDQLYECGALLAPEHPEDGKAPARFFTTFSLSKYEVG
jgi:hypothetical protein